MRNKQIHGQDEKIVKPTQILESIMNAWNVIINSSAEELYVDFSMQFKSM